MQSEFSLIKVKVLLVSLLSAFRDLTLMGVQAFDFNHLNNVLIFRDHRMVRLIDIEDAHTRMRRDANAEDADRLEDIKPALHIDLHTILPQVVKQLILGKGRGPVFLHNTISQLWQAKSDEEAKSIIKEVIHENFYG